MTTPPEDGGVPDNTQAAAPPYGVAIVDAGRVLHAPPYGIPVIRDPKKKNPKKPPIDDF